MLELIVSFVTLSNIMVSNVVFDIEDNNRDKIDPGKLMNGVHNFASSSDRRVLYEFLARYVRKVHPDTDIKKDLRNNEGLFFIDRITPSDIVFVISVLKNGCDVWDEGIRMKSLGMTVHSEKAVKLRSLFTGGKGKKKEHGMSLWSVDGLKYFRRVERK